MSMTYPYQAADEATDFTPPGPRDYQGLFSSEEIHSWYVPMSYRKQTGVDGSGNPTFGDVLYKGVPFPLIFAESGETPPEPANTTVDWVQGGTQRRRITDPNHTTRVCRGFPFSAVNTSWKAKFAANVLYTLYHRCPLQSFLKDETVDAYPPPDALNAGFLNQTTTDLSRQMRHQRGAVAMSIETRERMTRRFPGVVDTDSGPAFTNTISQSALNPNPSEALQGYHSYVNYVRAAIGSGVQTTYRHLYFFKKPLVDVTQAQIVAMRNEVLDKWSTLTGSGARVGLPIGRVDTENMVGIKFGYYGRRGKILRLWHSHWEQGIAGSNQELQAGVTSFF